MKHDTLVVSAETVETIAAPATAAQVLGLIAAGLSLAAAIAAVS